MADNKKDNGGEIEDDAFDVEEFSDMDFDDEAALEDDNEFADLSPDDVDEYAEDEDNLGDEDWEDGEEQTGKKGKKKKDLYSTGEKKGLSFNTMVTIGAVVLGGGVLVFNVMSKTAEQNAGKTSVFQSIMSMAGVMDGTLWGDDKADAPTPETTAQGENKPDSGFLDNPDSVVPEPKEAANPPQPSPIAPAENGDTALTPLPNGETPRGPDESPPVATDKVADGSQQVPVVPLDAADTNKPSDVPAPATAPTDTATTTAAPSAEDILKKAMANREQKQDGKATGITADATKPAEVPVPEKVADANPVPPVIPPVDEKPVVEKASPTDKPVSVADETPPPSPVVQQPAANPAEVAANKQAVEGLESKIDTLLKRMDQIETEIGTVKEAKGDDYQALQTTVADLKQQITEIKERPAPAAAKPVREKPAPKEETDDSVDSAPVAASDEPKPAPAPKKKVKKAATTATSNVASASGRWELRAAQPGRAWVSKPGARDMQGVEVGQNLAGIGKVTAISYQNGRWTVYGTQGQINQ